MEIRYEKYILHKLDETTETWTITHIYAPTGHFVDKHGLKAGWHIQLGTGASPDDYTAVEDPGVTHDVPDTLPDVEIWEEPAPEPGPEPEEPEEAAEV
jgi:hypothetical protein